MPLLEAAVGLAGPKQTWPLREQLGDGLRLGEADVLEHFAHEHDCFPCKAVVADDGLQVGMETVQDLILLLPDLGCATLPLADVAFARPRRLFEALGEDTKDGSLCSR